MVDHLASFRIGALAAREWEVEASIDETGGRPYDAATVSRGRGAHRLESLISDTPELEIMKALSFGAEPNLGVTGRLASRGYDDAWNKGGEVLHKCKSPSART